MGNELDSLLSTEVGLVKEVIKLECSIDDVDVVIDDWNLMVVEVTDKPLGDPEFEVAIVVPIKC